MSAHKFADYCRRIPKMTGQRKLAALRREILKAVPHDSATPSLVGVIEPAQLTPSVLDRQLREAQDMIVERAESRTRNPW